MSNPDPAGRFFGALLMAVGGLIALLSGGCSVLLAGVSLTEASAQGWRGIEQMLQLSPLVLIFGGVPFVVGAGIFLLGRGLWRGPKT